MDLTNYIPDDFKDTISYSTYKDDVKFSFSLTSGSYDLSDVSELFPQLIDFVIDYLNGVDKDSEDDN